MKRFLNSPWARYLLYTLALLPVFLLRDFSLDNELRYLSIADEALRNHSIFTFTNHGILYADKPPLYLWIVMMGKSILGFHSLLFLGLFSLVPALAILALMNRWVKNLLSAPAILMAELMLLTSGLFIGSAIILRMDMLMCLFIVLSLSTFFKMHQQQGSGLDAWLFPLWVFMAIFSKGPIGLIVPLISTTLFLFIKKEMKTMGRYWGFQTMAILLSLCALWFTGVYAEGGKGYFNELLFNQTLHRAVNSFHHKEPAWYYLVAIWYSIIPWSLLSIVTLVVGMRKKLLSNDTELLFLVVSLSTLFILSVFSSKLAVYLLPAIPFIIYLSVIWLQKLGLTSWTLWMAAIPALLLCLALPALFLLPTFNLSVPPAMWAAALLLFASGFWSLKYLKKRELTRGVTTLCSGLMIAIFVFSFAIPAYNANIGLGQLCQKARQIALQKGAAHYYYCKISRADNLDVYLGVEPAKLQIKELYHPKPTLQKPAILFLSDKYIGRSDSIRQFIKGKKLHRSGDYYCVEWD